METEELIQAAKEIKEICDNADGCDECPFSREDGLYSVICKFVDKSGHICRPSEWSLNMEEESIKKPLKPEKGEPYWSATCWGILYSEWQGSMSDLAYYAVGNCFRTEKDAEAHREEVLALLKKIYDDGKPMIGADEWKSGSGS